MKALTTALLAGFILALVGLSIWWSVYKYSDCLKVGHSKLYCIGRFLGE